MNIYTIKDPSSDYVYTITERANHIEAVTIGLYTDQELDQDQCKPLTDYLLGKSKTIPLKYKVIGTEFEHKVWNEILKIPYGETRTYGEIAKNIGLPKAYRAVANACGANRVALLIPCHRVVGKSKLGGYKWGIDYKEKILAFEQAHV